MRRLAVGLLLVCLLSGCFVHAVEQGIERALATKLGPADACVVHVLGTSDGDISKGLLRELTVEATRVRPAKAPVIEHLSAHMVDANFDVSTRALLRSKRAELTVEFREQDMVAWLQGQKATLKTLRMLVLKDNQVVIFIDRLKLRVLGRLVMKGLEIEVELKEATEGGVAMDPDEASLLMDEVNPLADLSSFPLGISTARLSSTPGRLALTATIDSVDTRAFGGSATVVDGPPVLVENERDGQTLVTIPAGSVTIGRANGPTEEGPAHAVSLQSFLLGRTEVTVAQFARFVQATAYKTTAERDGWSAVWLNGAWRKVTGASWRFPSGPDSAALETAPVVHVSQVDAEAYCAWAELRLPTEDEWEWAARGRAGLAFPWGAAFEPERCVSSVGGAAPVGGVLAVGRFAAGACPFGCLDMAGNVWEWTGSRSARYAGNVDHKFYDDSAFVIRGGSWAVIDAEKLRTTARSYGAPLLHSGQIGFRCAKSR